MFIWGSGGTFSQVSLCSKASCSSFIDTCHLGSWIAVLKDLGSVIVVNNAVWERDKWCLTEEKDTWSGNYFDLTIPVWDLVTTELAGRVSEREGV